MCACERLTVCVKFVWFGVAWCGVVVRACVRAGGRACVCVWVCGSVCERACVCAYVRACLVFVGEACENMLHSSGIF